jgi:hypothetical protein
MKKVIYKGTTQYPDAETGELAKISSDGKSPIEMPDDIADTLIARGRAVEVKDEVDQDEQPAEGNKVKGKKGKSADPVNV